MIGVAANTWGISGGDFLLIYSALCLACFVVVWLRRQQLIQPGPLPQKYRLDECELAMLNGGADLAVTVAGAALGRMGAVVPGQKRRLEVRHRPASHANPIERELFETLADQPSLSIRKLKRELRHAPVVTQVQDRLVARGLLIDPRRARRLAQVWQLGLPIWVSGSRGSGLELRTTSRLATSLFSCALSRL